MFSRSTLRCSGNTMRYERVSPSGRKEKGLCFGQGAFPADVGIRARSKLQTPCYLTLITPNSPFA
jgi:hypothetical protein